MTETSRFAVDRCEASLHLSPSGKARLELLLTLPHEDRPGLLQRVGATESFIGTGGQDDISDRGFNAAWALSVSFACSLSAVVFYGLHVLYVEWRRYRQSKAVGHRTFRKYIAYRFGYWYTYTRGAAGIVLFSLSLTLLVVGGLLLQAVDGRPVADSLWCAWIWMAAPDGGGSAESSFDRAVGILVSIGGMLIFALFMSVVSSTFEALLDEFRTGSLPVIEGGHCVIIGCGPMLTTIIDELCRAAESRGGNLIVLLTPLPKVEVEALVRESGVILRGSSIVVRCGDADKEEDLRKVAVEDAEKVVIFTSRRSGASREDSDAATLNVLVTLKNNGWPRHGACIVQCELLLNRRLFTHLLPDLRSEVLTTYDCVAELMVKCSRQHGLADIVSTIFSQQGDDLYLADVAGIAGLTFREVLFRLPQAILLGVMSRESRQVEMLPAMDRQFTDEELLVVLTEDMSTVPDKITKTTEYTSSGQFLALGGEAERCSPAKRMRRADSTALLDSDAPQIVVIIGWNDIVGAAMMDIDVSVPPLSQVIVHSSVAAAIREEVLGLEQRLRRHKYRNIDVKHSVGPVFSRVQLQDLPLEKAQRILILAESSAESPRQADGQTVAVMFQVQDILQERRRSTCAIADNSPDTILLPQLLEVGSERSFLEANFRDYVNSNSLAAKIISAVCEVPQIAGIIECIVRQDVQFATRSLYDYPGARQLSVSDGGVTFDEVAVVAALSGEVAIGWSAIGATESGPWDLNPKLRNQRRPWQSGSRIAVLKRNPTP
eukprot:TRINITY_DN75007_c0_g1_i1.p1 TRINITY_DN75007_c0_g1~~TRINITY_DN75007_c0_g1_i1.p1  ORF type:complete len:774 (-),score=146.56 TRINITY_DN75007_c0_g1_i1:265-2586(-)